MQSSHLAQVTVILSPSRVGCLSPQLLSPAHLLLLAQVTEPDRCRRNGLGGQPQQRSRSFSGEELEDVMIGSHHTWQIASNFTTESTRVDEIAFTIPGP
jgi:hypothetical protein